MSKQDLQDQIDAINTRIADLATSLAALHAAIATGTAVATAVKKSVAKKAGDANA